MTQSWKRELITSDDRIRTADDLNRLECSAEKNRDKYKVLCLRGENNQQLSCPSIELGDLY